MTEKTLGADHPELIDTQEQYAAMLRSAGQDK